MKHITGATMDEIKNAAIDWCLINGLVVRAAPPTSQTTPPTFQGVTHAPFALYPSLIPKHCYQQALKLQPLFNSLVETLSQDHAFITEVMESIANVDPFIAACYDIYKAVLAEGISQKITFGIHRSDYLLHRTHGADGVKDEIQQVELNTIASSFSSLSSKTGELHRYLDDRFGTRYKEHAPHTYPHAYSLPQNISFVSLAKGIGRAFDLYHVPSAVVVMVVQPGERNAFDQRHGVRLLRRTLAEINEHGSLHGDEKRLHIDGEEVAVVYFRAGYAPTDYPTAKEWTARLLIERSYAIKCPNISYHLVGSKKVQQILAQPNVLERFVKDAEHSTLLRSCFTGLYPLDESPEGLEAYKKAMADPSGFVMKPQREGGGNNFYGDDIKNELLKLTPKERNAYILMDLIRSPTLRNIMVRNGELIEADVVSELGIYGIWLSDGNVVHVNECGGHLLRTKSSASHEGGVAAGFAVLDSPLLYQHH
ncbi:Glutathione synthetase [Blyttiomyces sp. JEL0837]|nr:Glutathione synthetase [Blyttiomyces sp. JEL0837]